MSYFCIDTTHQELINEEKGNGTMEPRQNTQEKKKRDHRNEKNPHFGCVMTQESKDRISRSQSERYEMIRKLVRKGMAQPIDEERVRQICNEVCDNYFKRIIMENQMNNNKPMDINL